MAFDGKAFGAEVVGVVKDYLERSLEPVITRLDAIERRLDDMPAPKDGKDADEDAVAASVHERVSAELSEIRSAIDAIPPAPELPDIPAMIEEAVNAAREQDAEQFTTWTAGIEEKIAAIPAPRDGKDADPEEIAALIKDEVETAVGAIPVPQDGKSVTVEDIAPLIEESVQKAVAAIPVPKDGRDGADVTGGTVDRHGHLVLTLSNGETKDFGLVIGSDGKDGDPGRDGADGVGFDDMDMVEADDGIFLRFAKDDVAKEWRLPIVRDCGVFKAGETYHVGDGVTWGGQFWIAQEQTEAKPGESRDGRPWRLAVRRGRDGKDAKPENK